MACFFICDICNKQRQCRMDKHLGLAPPVGWTHTKQRGKKITICTQCLKNKDIDPIEK